MNCINEIGRDFDPYEKSEQSPEEKLLNIREKLYSKKEYNQYYWNHVCKGEKILELKNISSFTFFMWNFRIKPFFCFYKKRSNFNKMFQIVQLYNSMIEEYIRDENTITTNPKNPSARFSIGCYHTDIRKLFDQKSVECFYEIEEKVNPFNGRHNIKKLSNCNYEYDNFKYIICKSFFLKYPFLYLFSYRRKLNKLLGVKTSIFHCFLPRKRWELNGL